MWKMILKRSGKMTDRSKKLVDSVITTTPKSISTIFDDMYNEIDKMIINLSRFSKKISNYPLYESTYIIFKKQFIKKMNKDKNLERYLK